MEIKNVDKIKNNIYYSNDARLDFDNLELMFLYIENYKQFRNFSLNLNAKYLFEYDGKSNILKIINNSNYVQLYPQNVNLKILCGKNGVGKSSIIDILQDIDKCNTAFIVYRTDRGNFVTNKKELSIIYNKLTCTCGKNVGNHSSLYFHLNNGKEIIDINSKNFQGDFCRGYLSHYKELNKILNKDYKKFFNYFGIGFNNADSMAESLQSFIQIKYDIPLNILAGLGNYFRENPVKFIMLYESCDSCFDRLHEKCKSEILPNDRNDVELLFDKILKLIYGIESFKQIEKINEEFIDLVYDTSGYKLKKLNKKTYKNKSVEDVLINTSYKMLKYQKSNEYDSSCYKEYLKKLKVFGERLNKLYGEPINGTTNFAFEDFFYFNLFKKTENGNIYFWKLSTGEQLRYITILNLYYKMVAANAQAQTLIFEDDIDANLHPEWCRQYVDMYIGAIKVFSKNKKKIRNIILSTHSPFVLSDTANDYIEYLEKDKKSKEYTTLRDKNKIPNTFAGNIMQMFADNFFLDSTMGKYSKEILKEVITYMDFKKIKNPLILKNNYSNEEKTVCVKKSSML